MVRLSDLPEDDRQHLLDKDCPAFESQPWVDGSPLTERRVAIVTTAGLQRRTDRSFQFKDGDYRVIPGDVDTAELVMSHSSVNFDRTGFQQDINVVFPLARLQEMQAAGEIGSVGAFHYSFMGAGVNPEDVEPTAREVAALLKQDNVDAVFLSPV